MKVNLIIQTGIFMVEDSEDKPAWFLEQVHFIFRLIDLPGEAIIPLVCYESASYKRHNLLESLRSRLKKENLLRAEQDLTFVF
jgi:cyanophycinase